MITTMEYQAQRLHTSRQPAMRIIYPIPMGMAPETVVKWLN
jgi:hypothetical protein